MSVIPPEEIPFAETFFLETHLSPYHNKLWAGLPKQFKKIVNNESKEAYKINAKAWISKVKNKQISSEQSELFDDIVDHPERYNEDSHFVRKLKELKLYPNDSFGIWNEHIDIYNNSENNNFSEESAIEMHNFLKDKFLVDELNDLVTVDLLMQRDFNILLILLHLDALIFKDNFKSISLYKYLTIGKIKGKRKLPSHLIWSVVKVVSFIESNRKINKSVDVPHSIPKDEDCFSLLDDRQAERIKYAVRQAKEGGSILYLSYIYQLVGSKKLYESSKVFNGFSLTGLWFIYMYSILFIGKYHSVQSDIYFFKSDLLFRLFKSKYKSEGKDCWPSDLSRY